MHYVIGSGPAGISCAKALLARGVEVTMLDVGIDLEPERGASLDEIRRQDPRTWKNSLQQIDASGVAPDFSGLPKKLLFGSDYPYRDVEEMLGIESHNSSCTQTFAKGGLSTIWGCAILPYRDSDIKGWPITTRDLAQHYSAVLQFMDLSAKQDDLATEFPLYTNNAQRLKQSTQAATLLEDMTKHKKQLLKNNFIFGSSRLALRAAEKNGKPGCVYCKQCMYGCPYGLLYNSAATVDELRADQKFTYKCDVIVEKIHEDDAGVVIFAKTRKGDSLTFKGKRAFIGAGVVASTRIMLLSMELYDTPLTIKDSQVFLLPVLRYKKTAGVHDEPMHTCAQIFIEHIDDQGLTTHMQLYGYNDLYKKAIENKAGAAYRAIRWPSNAAIARLFIVMGFIHSDHSSSISVTLRKMQDGTSTVEVRGHKHKAAKRAVNKITRTMLKNHRNFGFVPVSPMKKIGIPGKSSHFGSTFPMTQTPNKIGESDTLGRPFGYKRVHLIDASVFPSIPATTITLSVMANAHRIGSDCDIR